LYFAGMAKFVSAPEVIPAAGQPPKIIEEFIGRANSATPEISIARMTSLPGRASRVKRRNLLSTAP
jgi:hypothetical protein